MKEGETEGEGVCDDVLLGLTETLGVSGGLLDGVGVGLALTVVDELTVDVVLPVSVVVDEPDGLAPRESEDVGVTVTLGVILGVGVAVPLALAPSVREDVGVAVSVLLKLSVELGVAVAVIDVVNVPVKLLVGDGVLEGVSDAVVEGVVVCVGDAETVLVGDAVMEGVALGVADPVSVDVALLEPELVAGADGVGKEDGGTVMRAVPLADVDADALAVAEELLLTFALAETRAEAEGVVLLLPEDVSDVLVRAVFDADADPVVTVENVGVTTEEAVAVVQAVGTGEAVVALETEADVDVEKLPTALREMDGDREDVSDGRALRVTDEEREPVLDNVGARVSLELLDVVDEGFCERLVEKVALNVMTFEMVATDESVERDESEAVAVAPVDSEGPCDGTLEEDAERVALMDDDPLETRVAEFVCVIHVVIVELGEGLPLRVDMALVMAEREADVEAEFEGDGEVERGGVGDRELRLVTVAVGVRLKSPLAVKSAVALDVTEGDAVDERDTRTEGVPIAVLSGLRVTGNDALLVEVSMFVRVADCELVTLGLMLGDFDAEDEADNVAVRLRAGEVEGERDTLLVDVTVALAVNVVDTLLVGMDDSVFIALDVVLPDAH